MINKKAPKKYITAIYFSLQEIELTLKKSHVEPWYNVPYCTSVCDARSSAELMGATILSTVRKAAKLAVYDEMRIRVKNHQTLPTILPDIDLHVPKGSDEKKRTSFIIKFYSNSKWTKEKNNSILFLLVHSFVIAKVSITYCLNLTIYIVIITSEQFRFEMKIFILLCS